MHELRIALGVRYDGSCYHGWQAQQEVSSVQQTLEAALSQVANHPVHVICAGRTDAGVHATAQVVHFTTEVVRSDHAWVFGANANLPHDISVTWAKPVSLDFHARFSAQRRRYRYILFNHSVRPGILRKAVGWYYRPLNEQLMHQAGQYLLGEHDFSAFRGSGCQAHSPVREVFAVTVTRQRRMVVMDITANAFLLHMVRNIAGVLIAIGAGDHPPTWCQEVLRSADRRQAAATVAPSGLYLVDVQYPQQFALPVTPLGPFFLP